MDIVLGLLFGGAALGGTLMFALRLRGGNPPLALAALHGVLAASALLTLLIVLLTREGFRGSRFIAFLVLLVAASLGLAINYQHRRGKLISLGAVFLKMMIVFMGLAILTAGLLGS